MRDTETERGRDTGRGRSRLPAGTQSQVSRIIPLAEGGAKPLSHPDCPEDKYFKWLFPSLNSGPGLKTK